MRRRGDAAGDRGGRGAFHPWRFRPAAERAALLERWYDLMLENLEDLARIMTAEQGKPLREARDEVRYGASFVKWFAGEARRIAGGSVPAPSAGSTACENRPPVAVA